MTEDDLDPLRLGEVEEAEDGADPADPLGLGELEEDAVESVASVPTIAGEVKAAQPIEMEFPDGPWVGVDLDGTLARHIPGFAERCMVGPPVPIMVTRVKMWLKHGVNVRIFTARMAGANPREHIAAIHDWCGKVGLPPLPITATKDPDCIELWDDRAVQVQTNTGMAMSTNPLVHSTFYRPGAGG